ncbi:MAG: hypothetical protein JXR49_15670 [Acidobacteria bacterium]|nr:hypothetical protein [Acidobacteriota bacterium]
MSDQIKTRTESKEKQVGYFCHLKVDEKHMGGILITNQVGIPLEFKYTEPIVATKLHKILYGSVLEKHLHETVIRDRLGAEIRALPDYFIVPYDEKEFLGSVEGREMVAIQKYNMPPGELSGPFNRIREREAVIELEEDSILLRLAFSTSDETIQHNIAAWLQEISLTMNLLEPMDRITSALKSICGEGKKG